MIQMWWAQRASKRGTGRTPQAMDKQEWDGFGVALVIWLLTVLVLVGLSLTR